jgi:transposase-like protein
MAHEPQTLQEAIVYFADQDNCIEYFAEKRWPLGVVCPHCGSDKVGYLKKQRRWQCSQRHPKRQFSAKVGTVMEDSPLGFDKWLPCIWLVVNCKNGISSHEIGRSLGVTQKTAWFMLHRVRLMLQDDSTGGKLDGEIEIDETFIGGKARNMHAKRRRKLDVKAGRGESGKTVVMGMLERGGRGARSRGC